MNPHERAASLIILKTIGKLKEKNGKFIITLAGESGCGKTETGKAFIEAFKRQGIEAMVLGQDNYFNLTPLPNDAQRKADPSWLGPRKEVNLERLYRNLQDFANGASQIVIPHIPYYSEEIEERILDVENIQVLIAEGTYTTLLRNVDVRIFIDANYHDTLKYRALRNRGNEVKDPFVEGILETEHKIISGHKFLADIVITKDYDVIFQS